MTKRTDQETSPLDIPLSDLQPSNFAAEAERQSRAVARSAQASDDQAFIDAVSEPL